ncbi:MAG: hypothetical protein U0T83_03590 [Bacteriovoracaceae bacterium]
MSESKLYKVEKEWLILPSFCNFGSMLNSIESLDQFIHDQKAGGFGHSLILPFKFNPSENIFSLTNIKNRYKNEIELSFALSLVHKTYHSSTPKFVNFSRFKNSENNFLNFFFHHRLDDPLTISYVYQAMLKAKDYDTIYISFPEFRELHPDGEIHEGNYSFELGLEGIPSLSEEAAVARDLEIAYSVGNRIHFHQISSKRSVELIRRAKKDKVKVTCGVGPHHLIYTHEKTFPFNTTFKYLPPLRDESDRMALLEGVEDGTIDTMALGFFTPEEIKVSEKNWTLKHFSESIFVSPMATTIFSELYDNLIIKEKFNLNKLLTILSTKPLALLKGTQKPFKLRYNIETKKIKKD